MFMVIGGVDFPFDGVMIRQIDGVAMGSPSGPVSGNVYVGFVSHEFLVLNIPRYIFVLLMIVGHTLLMEIEFWSWRKLDSLHPALKFSCVWI